MNGNIPYGYIYKITNKINGKSYIGMRMLSKDRYWRQYLGSGKLVQQAVDKYGKENFVKTLVCYAETAEQLQDIEWMKIRYFKSIGQAEYNIFLGKSAGGDTFARLKGKRKEEVLRKQAEGVRKSIPARTSKAKLRSEEKYRNFVIDYKDSIEKSYRRTYNFKVTAEELKLQINLVGRFVKESGLLDELAPQREILRLEGQKIYFEQRSGGLKPGFRKCQFCSIPFYNSKARYCSEDCKMTAKRNRKESRASKAIFSSNYEELFQLWVMEDKTIEEIMAHFNCAGRTVYTLLERNGVPRKSEAKKLREEIFPVPLRKCPICEGDIPKQFNGATCSNSCRIEKLRQDRAAK